MVEQDGADPHEQSEADTAAQRRWPRRLVPLAVTASVIAAVVTVFATGLGRDPSVVPSRAVGDHAPPLAGTTLDGAPFDLADHRGSVVLVNVWASWCEPCRAEYPLLVAASRELGPRGLVVVGINTEDTAEKAFAFLREMGGQEYPSVEDRDGRHAVEWGTFGVPETFVVDRDGVVRTRGIGEVNAEWIAQNVVPLLGG